MELVLLPHSRSQGGPRGDRNCCEFIRFLSLAECQIKPSFMVGPFLLCSNSVQSTEVETNDDFKHWAAEVPVAGDLCHVVISVISICRQSIQQQRVRLKCQRFEGCLDFDFPTSGTLVLVIWC